MDSFAQAPRFTPDGRHIVYMAGKDADIFPLSLQGADWWIMHVDGTHKQRLTYMNKQRHPQSDGHFKLAGSLSFVSDNDFFGDAMTKSLGLTGYIVHAQLRKECIE